MKTVYFSFKKQTERSSVCSAQHNCKEGTTFHSPLPRTGPRAPRGGVTRQGVLLTYLLSFVIGSQ